ncbi:uncharacterized protein LOC113315790 [Papaver somniferum]|uniref:uncharacterized protein LOC113315790 n=1 Tax=Papaver somniferum TaxID=3469 RepID=UPI000E6FEB7F|nr:uncharacterized protein LOC113315790 [Papaver somniferum]
MVWDHYSGLSLEYWDEETLFTISRAIGTPIKVDATTLQYQSGYYAKVLVEIDLAKTISNKLWIITKYGAFSQGVTLTKLPKFCTKCKIVGHLTTECIVSQQSSKAGSSNEVEKKIIIDQNQSSPSSRLMPSEQQKSSQVQNPHNSGNLTIPPINLDITKLIQHPHVSMENHSTEVTEINSDLNIINSTIDIKVTQNPFESSEEVGSSKSSKKKPPLKPAVVTRKASKEYLKHMIDKGSLSPQPPPQGDVLVTGVHANSYTINRRELWQDLSDISLMNKPWLVLGDFNTILSIDEKRGGTSLISTSMKDFQDCVDFCGLLQAPKNGLDFSLCNGRDGNKRILCNLDGALFNLKWLDKFNGWHYKVGNRGISDHSHLLGSDAIIPRAPNPPFRFQQMWLNYPNFLQVFCDVKDTLKKAEEKVLEETLKSDSDPTNINLLNNLVTARGLCDMAANNYNTFLRDKARISWIQDGDVNTKFFHTSIKLRQAQNAISEIENSSGNTITDQLGVSNVLIDYFSTKFAHQNVSIHDSFFEASPTAITAEDNSFLEKVPSEEDIRNAVFDLNQDSAPGPDGFTGIFYRFAWEVIKTDLVTAVQYCWENNFIPSGMNSNFLVLIPKVHGAKNAKQFRPIGLSNFCFKVITKIVTMRISQYLPKIISPQQCAFIKNRNIHEQVLLASELVNELSVKRRGGNLGLKLDISQAYDTMSWDFFCKALTRYGFSKKFCDWVMVLLKTTKLSIMVNGGPIGFFGVGRGLKQGDPLSPILFILVEYILSRNNHKLVHERKILPMVIRNGIHRTHLLFAGDIFLFCNGNMRSITHLRNLLKEYQAATSHIINTSKSRCFVSGTSSVRKRQIADFFHMDISNFPDKYLGVMLV